jgi:microcystin-dependent protein
MRLSLILGLVSLFPNIAPAASLTVSPGQVFPGVYQTFQNYHPNPSCGKNAVGYTASAGTVTADTTSTALIDGAKSCKFTPSSAGNYVETTTGLTTRVDHRGKNCEARVSVMGDASGYTIGLYDSGSLVSSVSGVSSTSAYQDYSIPYPCGGSGSSYKIRLTSTTGTNAVNFGNVYFGPITNLSSVDQASFVGSSYFAVTASCDWSRTNTSPGAFSTTAACPGPTVEESLLGSWQTTDADLPQQTINNLPAGRYEVIFTGDGGAITSGGVTAYTISDGTTTSGAGYGDTSNAGASQFTVRGFFNYTSPGNRTFALWGSAASGITNRVYNSLTATTTRIQVVRMAGTTQSAIAPPQRAELIGTVFYNSSSTCPVNSLAADGSAVSRSTYSALFAKIGTTFGVGDGSTTFNLPNLQGIFIRGSGSQTISGLTYTGTLATKSYATTGRPNDTAFTGTTNTTGAHTHTIQASGLLAQSGASYGVVGSNGTSQSSSNGNHSHTVSINGGGDTETAPANIGMLACIWNTSTPAPLLVGSVTSNSAGMERHERATFLCSGSSAVNSQSGTWISSIGNVSSGACTLNITSGIFSGTPSCIAGITEDPGATMEAAAITSVSSSSVVVKCKSQSSGTTANCTGYTGSIQCTGPR